MGTRNLIPVNDNEGQIGNILKKWAEGNFHKLNTIALDFKTAISVEIDSDEITTDQVLNIIDTEGAIALDELSTINFNNSAVIFIKSTNNARVINVKHNVGNILIDSGADVVLDNADKILMLVKVEDMWLVINSGSGGGGGVDKFIELTDVPSSYIGMGGKVVKVNGTATALEFTDEGSSPSYSSKNGTFTGFATAESQSINITGMPSSRMHISKGKIYINSNPVRNKNVSGRLSFYSKDTWLEKNLLKDFYFNLTYTETTGGASRGDTTDTVYSIDGLIKYDLVRYLGGTAENIRLTASPSTLSLTFEALSNNHSTDTGRVKVVELPDFDLQDEDLTPFEVHAKLELYDALGNSTDIKLEFDVVRLG